MRASWAMAPGTLGPPVFRGRETELEDLVEVMLSTTGVVLVEAESGTGLSRLLSEAAAVARRARREVELLAPAQLAQTVATGSLNRPSAIFVVDDADAAPAATLDVLASIVRSRRHMWLLGIHRPDRNDGTTTRRYDKLAAVAERRLVLGSLPEAAAHAVVADRFGAVTDAGWQAAAIAGGRVALLVELLDDLAGGSSMPAALVVRRLERLPRRARVAVQAASMLRPIFLAAELAELTPLDGYQMAEALRASAAVGLLRSHGPAWTFRHPQLRRAVHDTIPTSIRPALRRQAINVLFAHGADPVEVGSDLANSATLGDVAAAAALRRAAATLAATSPHRAAQFGRRAMEIDPRTVEDDEFAARIAGLLWQTQTPPKMRELTQGLPSQSSAAGSRVLQHAVRHWTSHDEDLAPRHGSTEPFPALSRSAGRTRAAEALTLALRGPGADADRAIAHARRLGLSTDDPLVEAGALVARSVRRATTDVPAARCDVAAATGLIVERPTVTREAVFASFWDVAMLAIEDRLDDCVARSGAMIASLEAEARVGEIRPWWALQATALLELGRLTEARMAADTVLAHDPGSDLSLDPIAARMWQVRLRVALHTAERQAVIDAQQRTASMSDGSPRCRRIAQWMKVISAESATSAEAAAGIVREAAKAIENGDPPMLLGQSAPEYVALGRLALQLGDRASAAAISSDLQRRSKRAPAVISLRASSRHLLALTDDDRTAAAEAAQLYARSGRELDRAVALQDLAQTSGATQSEVVDTLSAGLVGFERMGARADAARVRAQLRVHGVVRRPSRGPEDSQFGLTPHEQAVANAVATGATDRQIAEQLSISPHTVRTHIRHIFAKLDVSSRIEIVKCLGRAQ